MSATFSLFSRTGNVVRVVVSPAPANGREARKAIAAELERVRPDLELQGSIGKPIYRGVYLVCYGVKNAR